ncbi:MAG: Ldh family oxidoreductase [bacterium]|nr:Ldh family oxidoreductase [bacterium]
MAVDGEHVLRLEPTEDEVVIQVEDLHRLARRLYGGAGVPEGDAELMADLQVETDVRGVHSHGTRALPGYIRRILGGHTNPKPEVRVIKEGPSYAMVDGDGCMGHLASVRAMQKAIGKANETGVGIASVIHSRHYGAAACYATMPLEHGMIGFAVSSSSKGVAPFGGTERVMGNHGLAHAVPAGEEYPLVLDMASGVSAWGRVGTMRMYGKKLHMDWVLDEDGNPTDDPHQAHVLLPAGGSNGPKGSAYNLLMDVLSGILPMGLATVNRVGEEFAGQQNASQFFQAIKVDNFIPLEEFTAEMDRMIQTVRNSRRKDGVDRIYLPGEMEWLKKEAWSKSGIPMHKRHVGSLEDMADELGVEVPWR